MPQPAYKAAHTLKLLKQCITTNFAGHPPPRTASRRHGVVYRGGDATACSQSDLLGRRTHHGLADSVAVVLGHHWL